MWIATADHCRSIDRRASEEYGITTKVLMERAGMAVFEAMKQMLPEGGSVSVLCGRGNNGGDGFVVARLAHDHGYQVECLVASLESELIPSAAEQMHITRALGIQPIFFDDARWVRKLEHLGTRELLVDALLGTGARQEVRGAIREAIQAINRSGVPVLAVDVPSGVSCDTGEELGDSVWALRTVTFGQPKPFLFEGIGLEHSGYWTVSTIGIPNALLSEPTGARLLTRDWVANLLPERMKASHKGDHGNLLIVAGSLRMRGAAILSALGALRSGAGLVTVASTPAVCEAVSAAVPEALTLPLPEEHGFIAAHASDVLLRAKHAFCAAAFGPGLGATPNVFDFLSNVWSEWGLPSVIDADALNAVGGGVRLPHVACVLTPHPGEMSRMLQTSIAEIQSDRFRTVSAAISRFGKCVLLKGAHSIVGTSGEPLMVNSTGNPGMASGGMGDVLTGVTGTLLAQKLPTYVAASLAMYWHGYSADLCACESGIVGLTATDVAHMLPKARARITQSCNTDR